MLFYQIRVIRFKMKPVFRYNRSIYPIPSATGSDLSSILTGAESNPTDPFQTWSRPFIKIKHWVQIKVRIQFSIRILGPLLMSLTRDHPPTRFSITRFLVGSSWLCISFKREGREGEGKEGAGGGNGRVGEVGGKRNKRGWTWRERRSATAW